MIHVFLWTLSFSSWHFFWRVRLQPSPYLTQPVIFTTGSLPWRKSSPYFLLLEPPETSIFWCFLVDFQSSNSRKNTNTFNFKLFFLQSLKLLNSWEFVVSEFISFNREAPFKKKHGHVAVKEEKRKSQIVVDSDDERGRWGVRFIEGGSGEVIASFSAAWCIVKPATFVGGDSGRCVFGIWWKTFLQLHTYAIFWLCIHISCNKLNKTMQMVRYYEIEDDDFAFRLQFCSASFLMIFPLIGHAQ